MTPASGALSRQVCATRVGSRANPFDGWNGSRAGMSNTDARRVMTRISALLSVNNNREEPWHDITVIYSHCHCAANRQPRERLEARELEYLISVTVDAHFPVIVDHCHSALSL